MARDETVIPAVQHDLLLVVFLRSRHAAFPLNLLIFVGCSVLSVKSLVYGISGFEVRREFETFLFAQTVMKNQFIPAL
jgi:hypothetical protein